MLVDERKGRAGHVALRRYAQAFSQALDEGSLASAERAIERDDVADLRHAADARRQSLHGAGAFHPQGDTPRRWGCHCFFMS